MAMKEIEHVVVNLNDIDIFFFLYLPNVEKIGRTEDSTSGTRDWSLVWFDSLWHPVKIDQFDGNPICMFLLFFLNLKSKHY